MKKVILTLVVVAGLSASCKKSYTCTCENSSTGAVTTSTVKATSTTSAESDCVALGSGTSVCGI